MESNLPRCSHWADLKHIAYCSFSNRREALQYPGLELQGDNDSVKSTSQVKMQYTVVASNRLCALPLSHTVPMSRICPSSKVRNDERCRIRHRSSGLHRVSSQNLSLNLLSTANVPMSKLLTYSTPVLALQTHRAVVVEHPGPVPQT